MTEIQIHFRSLNLNHFTNVEAVGLKITVWWSLSMASPPLKINPNLPISSKVIGVGGTQRQPERLVLKASFQVLERRLKGLHVLCY
jgi:hypothetical protein